MTTPTDKAVPMDGVFIIAEAGVNHNGSHSLAQEMVYAAAEAGADAVKFQTFTADKLVLKGAQKADYQLRNTRSGDSQYEMLKALELSTEQQIELSDLCLSRGIEFMSSPFDCDNVDFLAREVAVRRLKIPSGEVVNGPLMLRAARTGLPLIVSSGMCSLEEIQESLSLVAWAVRHPGEHPPSRSALAAIRAEEEWTRALYDRVCLLQCVTQYPAPPAATNLRAMATLGAATGLQVGFSDHSEGWHIPVAAAALGARVLEKHFTLSRRLPGPDHRASLEPDELQRMIREIRDVEVALGDGVKQPNAEEMKNRLAARGSIVASRPIRKAELFSNENLTVKRPGSGVEPFRIWDIIGTAASRDYGADEQIFSDERR